MSSGRSSCVETAPKSRLLPPATKGAAMSTTTTRTGNNTHDARFLAPETHQRAGDQLHFVGSPCSGINGRLPALASAQAGPCHLLPDALAPALLRGALGVARRPTNAGQRSAQDRSQRRGTNSHKRLPRKVGQVFASQRQRGTQ